MSRRADGTINRRNVDRINDARAIHSPPAFAEFLVELARNATLRTALRRRKDGER